MRAYDRPADTRPENRSGAGHMRSPGAPADFEPLLHELLATRARYEALRISDGPWVDRAMLLFRLHELRSNMAQIRRGSR